MFLPFPKYPIDDMEQNQGGGTSKYSHHSI